MVESKQRPHPATIAVLLLVLGITTGWAAPDPLVGRPASGGATHEPGARIALASDHAVAPDRATWSAALAGRSAQLALVAGASAIARIRQLAPPIPVAKPAAASKQLAQSPLAKPVASAYSGRNRFWIPSLKMSYRVHLFECSRKRDPDHYMYRWGCAGANNVYIMGHASSVMKPLHDLYEAGRLRVGMKAVYADGTGRVTTYRVTEWRILDPVDSHWAIASQSVPSMTLQTCVGPNGTLRLSVRLVAVD